jgi:hypothetical protein
VRDAILPCNGHLADMTTYTLIPTEDGYHIGVAGSDGARHTMLGFASKEEAEAWILQDKRLNNSADTYQGQESTA